jgi:hypothetical protein
MVMKPQFLPIFRLGAMCDVAPFSAKIALKNQEFP